MSTLVVRTWMLSLLIVTTLGCGRARTVEGDWTFTGPKGEHFEATFKDSKVTYRSKGDRYTLITSGTYTTEKPESITINLTSYVLENSTLTSQEEAYYRTLPAYRAEYTLDWKSSDEFVLSQVVAPGRFRDTQPLIYRRKD